MLGLIEHGIIIALAIMLFITFSQYNIILAIIWTFSRMTEGLINTYNEKDYWGLLKIARQYSLSSGIEKKALIDSGRSILKTKNSVFAFAQIFFSIGTLSYSILFITTEVVPEIIGWFGLISGIIYGLGNGIKFVKPKFQALWNLGGLLIWIFEIIIGGWLIYFGVIM